MVLQGTFSRKNDENCYLIKFEINPRNCAIYIYIIMP